MSATDVPEARKVESIFHPSDFSEASEVAFAHALKIALVAKTKLTMLHVSSSPGTEWQDFPGVRDTLERWQLIPKGSSKSAVGQLGIDVRKVIASSKDPVKACLGFLEKHPEDLIVLAVHQDKGRTRWLEKSVGKPIAREAGQMTLFIPHGVEGFISRKDGSISEIPDPVDLADRRRLLPVAPDAAPEALRLADVQDLAARVLHEVHAGSVGQVGEGRPELGGHGLIIGRIARPALLGPASSHASRGGLPRQADVHGPARPVGEVHEQPVCARGQALRAPVEVVLAPVPAER